MPDLIPGPGERLERKMATKTLLLRNMRGVIEGFRKRKYRTYLCDKFQVDMTKIEAVVNILVVAEE